jgi:hypothetical protein
MTSFALPGVMGRAQVYCIHNRQKRRVTDTQYNPAQTKVHVCACCENLFLERSDEPMFCSPCRKPPFHAQNGPLPPPRGVL